MKKIIEDILTEEKIARERVDQTREKIKAMRIDAEKEAKKIVSDARRKGTEASQALIHRVEEDARREKEKALQKNSKTTESIWTEKEHIISETIEVLYKMVLEEDAG